MAKNKGKQSSGESKKEQIKEIVEKRGNMSHDYVEGKFGHIIKVLDTIPPPDPKKEK